jgi:hypothetical protein
MDYSLIVTQKPVVRDWVGFGIKKIGSYKVRPSNSKVKRLFVTI